jgi:hypothetical protein
LVIYDVKERITRLRSRQGYTYHLLLFDDNRGTVMHYRVFGPSDLDTRWWAVFPVSDVNFGYFSEIIGPWLRSNLNASTNALSEKRKGTGDAH